MTICGRVFDLDSTLPECPPTIEVRAYDPLALAASPLGAPLTTVAVDQCGFFIVFNLPVPSDAFVAIGTDDAPGAADDHALTVVALPATADQTLRNVTVFAALRTTLQTWSLAAGLPAGAAETDGAYVPIFLDTHMGVTLVPPFRGSPVGGVTVTKSAAADPSAHYFTDGDPLARRVVSSSATVTGTNGSAVILGAPNDTYSGAGAEPAGCTWPSLPGGFSPSGPAAPRDLVLVQTLSSTCP